MEERKSDLTRLPQRKPKYRRENIVALSNVPRKVINVLVQTDIPEVYVYGYDVAYQWMHFGKSICIKAWHRRRKPSYRKK